MGGRGGKDGVGRKIIGGGKETLVTSSLASWLIYWHDGAPTVVGCGCAVEKIASLRVNIRERSSGQGVRGHVQLLAQSREADPSLG